MQVHKWRHFPTTSRFLLHGVQLESSYCQSSVPVSVSFWNQITLGRSNQFVIQSADNWLTNDAVTCIPHPYTVCNLASIFVTVSMKGGIVLIQLILSYTFFNFLVNLLRKDTLWSSKVSAGRVLIGSLCTSIVFSQQATPCHVYLSPHL
jgi:hypothetical protein